MGAAALSCRVASPDVLLAQFSDWQVAANHHEPEEQEEEEL